jgi:DNA repair exonuclease SbcCD ATPase subunit
MNPSEVYIAERKVRAQLQHLTRRMTELQKMVDEYQELKERETELVLKLVNLNSLLPEKERERRYREGLKKFHPSIYARIYNRLPEGETSIPPPQSVPEEHPAVDKDNPRKSI